MKRLFSGETPRSRLVIALSIYVFLTTVFFLLSARDRLVSHTPYNHFALLADSWLHGRLDLGGRPPAYAGGNDFALYHGKWFVSFPPFPAVLLLPWVALAGSPENLRDGQVFLWLAGIGPSVLYLVLARLSREGDSPRSNVTNIVLAVLFALGTVYWFTAEQGTVWFAAHVVSVGLSACFLLFSIRAKHPLLAGLLLGLSWLTRPSTVLLGMFFAFEAWRSSLRPLNAQSEETVRNDGRSLLSRVQRQWARVDQRRLWKTLLLFAGPALAALLISMWHNYARFGDPTEFGHRLLTVGWKTRIDRWGLFSYHYLGRNLGVLLSSLPYLEHTPAGLQVNGHGLALWVTTPLYFWVLWPRKATPQYRTLALTAGAIALVDLLYQNSGWVQFGYRFSNDYALLLLLMLATGARRFGKMFWAAAIASVTVNAFGAVTFDRAKYRQYYFIDPTQRILYQPD